MKVTGPQFLAGGALLGLFWYFTRRPESDVIEEGIPLPVIVPPAAIFFQLGQDAPAGTPGILRVDLGLSVNSFLVGAAMPRAREAVTPSKLKSLLAYMQKNCPTLPKPTGAATAQVAAGGPGVLISVKVPVLFATQPDAALRACIEKALRRSSSDINERFASLTVKAEQA